MMTPTRLRQLEEKLRALHHPVTIVPDSWTTMSTHIVQLRLNELGYAEAGNATEAARYYRDLVAEAEYYAKALACHGFDAEEQQAAIDRLMLSAQVEFDERLQRGTWRLQLGVILQCR